MRVSDIPLFPGYVFFDSEAISRSKFLTCRKIVEIIAPPDSKQLDSELKNLHCALAFDPALREARFGVVGKPVVVTKGPLKGLCGEFVRFGSQARLIIRVSFLGKAAEMAIDEAFVSAGG